MPPSVKPPSFERKSPAPSVSVTAAVMRLRAREKSTWFCTQMRPPVAAIRPNTTIDSAAQHRRRESVMISAPNLGEKPSTIAISAATTNSSVE